MSMATADKSGNAAAQTAPAGADSAATTGVNQVIISPEQNARANASRRSVQKR